MSNEFTKDPWGNMAYIDEENYAIEVQADWGEGAVYIECTDGGDGDVAGVAVPAAALIAAIEEVAGIKRDAPDTPGHVQVQVSEDKPEPLWTEVRERPARAVEVTPDLVRTLAGDEVPPELLGLVPEFNRATGEPVGVIVFDRPGVAAIGRYVVLSGARGTAVLEPEEFERLFEEVSE